MISAAPGEPEPGPPAPSHVAFATFARASTRRHVAAPLILAAAFAVALVASLQPLAMRVDGETAAALQPFVERFFGNGFSRAILIVFLTAALYGVLQLIGIAVDRSRMQLLWLPGGEARASWFALIAGRPFRPCGDVTALWTDGSEGGRHEMADRYAVQRHRHADLGLLPIRFAVWVLPLLGFIGTVVGIAQSIDGLEAVIAPGAGGQSAEGFATVLGGLRFAFDTTLLGLATVIPVMLLQMVLVGRESEVTEESRHRVLALAAGPSDADDALDAVRQAAVPAEPPSPRSADPRGE